MTLAERLFGIGGSDGLTLALALAGGTLFVGVLLLVANPAAARAAPAASAERERVSPFAGLLGAAFLVVAALVMSRFRFYEDDFFQLMRATDLPLEMDDSLRLLSCALLYGAGLRLGRAWFVAVNVVTWLGTAALFYLLLRRAGRSRDEALIAALLAGVAPGWFGLVSSAIGFQTSASIALYYAILLLVDAAARTLADERARRAGFLLAAIGVTALGVFVKYPMMSVVPVLAWIWATRVVRDAPWPLSRPAFYLAFVAAVAIPLGLTHELRPEAGELTKAGTSAIADNLVHLWDWLSPSLERLGRGAAVLYLGVALQGAGEAPQDGLRRAAGAAREDLRRVVGSGHLLAMGLLAAVAVAPFLFNARYFAEYYVAPLGAWIAAVAAIPLAAAARRLRGAGLVAAALSVITLIPVRAVKNRFDDSLTSQPARLLDAVRRATVDRPAPCGLVLEAWCDTPEATVAQTDALGRVFDATGNGGGLRWATGWHEVDVAIAGDGEWRRGAIAPSCAAPLTLRTCEGRTLPADLTPQPPSP